MARLPGFLLEDSPMRIIATAGRSAEQWFNLRPNTLRVPRDGAAQVWQFFMPQQLAGVLLSQNRVAIEDEHNAN